MKYHIYDAVITAGSTYLDIDAYACMVAMTELLKLKGKKAIAFSAAPCNYSICKSLINESQIARKLPTDTNEEIKYIIVDVSDPEFLKESVPLNRITEIYDHHVGFERYWCERIGENSHIEFIGAAATLIYREWKKAGVQDKMTRSTALLLIAAILDNTLNLTSSNTTQEDIATFNELCEKENIGKEWCADYFSQVQLNIEKDLKNALFTDMKTVRNNDILPSKVAQLCLWDANSVLLKLSQIREWFKEGTDSWMINIIDIKNRCNYFVCDDECCQREIEKTFDVTFKYGVAVTKTLYLRKEIIKKTLK